jgi:putative endonuclease
MILDGNQGEILAKRFLIKKGYRIIEVNYRCRIGEIDIIASNDDKICFVEVKTRNSLIYGRPFESVNCFKQNRIRKIAQHFLILNKQYQDLSPRFDVISIYLSQRSRKVQIEFIPNAF